MKEFIIEENEAGQRFDKYLAKLLREAPKSFFYKMIRKKNITLNGKKATGNEKLLKGDTIKLFLSDETFDKFAGSSQAARAYCELDIVYEDPDIIIINKPAGMLSQPADDGEPSLVEYLTLQKNSSKPSDLLYVTDLTVIPAEWSVQVKALPVCSFCPGYSTTEHFTNTISASQKAK